MADVNFFTRGKVQDFKDLLREKDGKGFKNSKQVLKRVIANITMGNDMSSLSPELLPLIKVPDLEIKKAIYLFVVSYAQFHPEIAEAFIPAFIQDTNDENPLIRGLAIRNMSSIPVEKFWLALCEPLRRALVDKDPFVCKAAAIAVAKLYSYSPAVVQREDLLARLTALLNHENANVLANAVRALMEVASIADTFDFSINIQIANRILTALDEGSAWSQFYLLDAILGVIPEDPVEAGLLCDRIVPRLQHANSGIVTSSVRILIYLSQYLQDGEKMIAVLEKCGPPLVTLLHRYPEIQYAALCSIQLIIQKYNDFLRTEFKVFYCKYNDAIYVKLAKLEVLFYMADESNISLILSELKEYAKEIDIDFVRKTVRTIGKCAIKIESSADQCVDILVNLFESRIDYVVQEAIVVVKDIFRRYPNRFEAIIRILCENIDSGIEEQEAKSAMIWIIGQNAERIENAAQLLSYFFEAPTFKSDTTRVKLTLLTAIIKLFVKKPSAGKTLVPKMLKYATEEDDDPDLRDRGFMYWRLLTANPTAAKMVVCGERPVIDINHDFDFDPAIMSRMLFNVSTLSSLSNSPDKMPAISADLTGRLLVQYNRSALLLRQAQAARKERADMARKEEIATKSPVITRPQAEIPITEGIQPGLQHFVPQSDSPYKEYQAAQNNARDLNPGTNSLISDLEGLNFFENNVADNASNLHYQQISNNYTNSFPFAPGEIQPQDNSQQLAALSAPNNAHNPFITQVYSPTNPFAHLTHQQGLNGRQETSQIQQISYGQESVNPFLNISGPISNNVLIDPFAQTSRSQELRPAPIKISAHLLLSAEAGMGLEILGRFIRLSSSPVPSLELDLSNRGTRPFSQFALILNRNTFGVIFTLNFQMIVGSPIAPGETRQVLLPLSFNTLTAAANPINNIQIALKHDLGIVYFQLLMSLFCVFQPEVEITPEQWLGEWQNAEMGQFKTTIRRNKNLSANDALERLRENRVFIVAKRTLETGDAGYLFVRLEEGTCIFAEINFQPQDAQSLITSKTRSNGMNQFLEAFNDSISDLLQ